MITLTTEQAQQIEEALKVADTVYKLSGKTHEPIRNNQALATIRAARAREQAEQEPVAWVKFQNGEITHAELSDGSGADMDLSDWTPLYAAPVRTKDLTDDEIMKINVDTAGIVPTCDRQFHFARAVIAADREKNK